jgi:hypothetical protein
MQRDRRRIYPIMVIGDRIPDPAMSLWDEFEEEYAQNFAELLSQFSLLLKS